MNRDEQRELKLFATRIRKESLGAMGSAGGGHVGGVLSIADALAVLYGKEMKVFPENPTHPDRDRLVLSKGHCGPALYAALALKGFFPPELLLTLNKNASLLPSHCNMFDTPGVDAGTGSLGQGASIAAGMALGFRMAGKTPRVYLILGDGECNEGQVWEMALFAAQNKLANLTAFVDYNHQQLDGYTADICDMGDIRRKFEDFGWNSVQVDGNDVVSVETAVQAAKKCEDRPSMIILDTVKGKGWSVTEGKPNVHHVALSRELVESAMEELDGRIRSLSIRRGEDK